MDRAHSAAAQGCAVSGTPAARSAPALRAGATLRVCSLWLLSLAQERESDSSARKADETTQGRESVLAKRPTREEAKVKALDPGLRRDDEAVSNRRAVKRNPNERKKKSRRPEGRR